MCSSAEPQNQITIGNWDYTKVAKGIDEAVKNQILLLNLEVQGCSSDEPQNQNTVGNWNYTEVLKTMQNQIEQSKKFGQTDESSSMN